MHRFCPLPYLEEWGHCALICGQTKGTPENFGCLAGVWTRPMELRWIQGGNLSTFAAAPPGLRGEENFSAAAPFPPHKSLRRTHFPRIPGQFLGCPQKDWPFGRCLARAKWARGAVRGRNPPPHPRASKHQWNNTGVRAQKSSSHFLGLHCRYEKDIFTQPVMPWCQSALKVWWPSSSN